MRPRKSSTLIKKSQTLIQHKQQTELNAFSTNPSQVSQTESNSSYPHVFQTTMKGRFEVRGNLNKGSINPTGFRRTFSRARNDNILSQQIKVETPLLTESKPTGFIENSIKQQTIKQSILKDEEKTFEIKKQPIPKTRVAFYQSTPKPNDKKPQTLSKPNPQQSSSTQKKTSSSGNRQQILNTRRSKLQTEVKKKQALQKQQKKKTLVTPLKKSKNINIHLVKNTSGVHNGEVKVEVKVEKSSQVVEKEDKEMKIEFKKQEKEKLEKQEEIKKEKPHQRVNLEQNLQPRASSLELQRTQPPTQTAQRIPQATTYPSSQPNIQQSIQNHRPSINLPSQQPTNSNRNQTQSSISSFTQSQIQQLRRPPSNHRPQQSNNQSQQNERENERSLNLTALIANTQDIINFINRLNLRSRVQAFDLMVEQLTQLNMIALQVQELGQIGNNLGYSLVNVFGVRIRQLQTTIINQVGQALIASFQERIDPEFQALVLRIRQPSLRQGFSKADIERTFEQKIAFEQTECSICLQNVKPGDTLIELQCFHEYHPICIRTWLENSRKCPMCRMEQKL